MRLYIRLVRNILEEAVNQHSAATGVTTGQILAQIREHIDATAQEHRADEPEINYEDPLCRLGYLYRHATANATLFEWVLRDSGHLGTKLRSSTGGKLHIFSIGGGPGTELLGLAKRLLRSNSRHPRKISFTVLDNVPERSETWSMLADASEEELRAELSNEKAEPPTVAPMFVPMDVLDPASYANIRYRFRDADIIVFNYLFSENKGRLADAGEAVRHLWNVAPSGCIFVVIDRLEHGGKFTADVVRLFTDAGAATPEVVEVSNYLDHDEQIEDMGALLTEVLGRPRVKFFTDIYRAPTVFWFDAVKG
jgi:hypothetical protein